MTPEERVELLCRRLASEVGVSQEAWRQFLPYFAQARADALEEAARVADDKRPDDGDPINLGFNIACEDIAAAIRGMK